MLRYTCQQKSSYASRLKLKTFRKVNLEYIYCNGAAYYSLVQLRSGPEDTSWVGKYNQQQSKIQAHLYCF